MSVVFRKILVPVDFSEPANTALYHAKELAQQPGAEFHLVHVIEDPMLLADWPVMASSQAREADDEAAPIRERLMKLITPEERGCIKSEVHVIAAEEP